MRKPALISCCLFQSSSRHQRSSTGANDPGIITIVQFELADTSDRSISKTSSIAFRQEPAPYAQPVVAKNSGNGFRMPAAGRLRWMCHGELQTPSSATRWFSWLSVPLFTASPPIFRSASLGRLVVDNDVAWSFNSGLLRSSSTPANVFVIDFSGHTLKRSLIPARAKSILLAGLDAPETDVL